MASVVIAGDTSGAITLSAPAVAGTNTITLPTSTGTMMVNGPTFSATLASGSVTITSATWTKMQLNSEGWDTANCYDPTTNYRFTPNVAGYYQVNVGVDAGLSTNFTQTVASIYRNGSIFRAGSNVVTGNNLNFVSVVSALVYLNGTTDYIEAYAYISATTARYASSVATWFDAAMIRSA